jgi:MFS transporter, putative metabolite:H+ symporter
VIGACAYISNFSGKTFSFRFPDQAKDETFREKGGSMAAEIAPVVFAGASVGPLETRHLQSPIYRNAADTIRLTSTHWHIAWANGLGWGFDGMDGAILALVAPLLMKEFAIDLPTYRSGVQIALFVSIAGLYLWPWLADRFGRRNVLAVNIAVFSLAMPLVALAPSWGAFILIYSIVRFALNGEWAVGSLLVAETWPARLRGFVLSVDRSAWGIGAALAGMLVTFVATDWGWRVAYVLPAAVALLAVYVRLMCPESPYWVRTQDRRQQIRDSQSAGYALDEDDLQWIAKTEQPRWRQLFLPDLRRNTVMATFVASLALVSYSTVGMWMPLFLAQQHGWSTAEYGSFYIWWAVFATTGYWAGGWMIDRLGRRVGFAVLLTEASVFMTIWVFAHDKVALWLLGMAWSWGFIGVWGPVTTYTAEMYPTRIRGVGNGFSWAVAFVIGAVLWPFVSVYLRETTGSFIAAFPLIPAILLAMAAIVWFYSPENARKELDAIAV